MPTNVETDKDEVRTAVLTRRAKRTAQAREQAAEAIALHAPAVAPLMRARRVAAHLSMPSEPGTAPLIQWLTDLGKEVIVPVSNPDRSLDWAHHRLEAVRTGAFGVPEPTGPRLGPGALADCEVAIVPALAADHQGNRLGRGAGYYDRALAEFPGIACALVFDDELLSTVPAVDHDRRVDLVLTPTGLFRPTRD